MLFVIGSVAAARAAVPPLLDAAIHKLVADEDHWAFTEKVQEYDRKGKPIGGTTIERYDPSQPFERQWQLFQYRGHAPTPQETASWHRARDRMMKRHGEKGLGDVLDLDHATVAVQSPDTTTFLVPIRKGASPHFPADKLEVFMDVDRKMQALRAFSLRPKGPFRLAGVIKVDAGEVDGRLEVVQANYTPVLVWVRGAGYGHVFGVFRVGRGEQVTYNDFKRVQPYNDRFEVKIGRIKALDF